MPIYQYTAFTPSQDGVTFETESLPTAIHEANKYARSAFPKAAPGYGAIAVVKVKETQVEIYRHRV